MKKDVTLNTVEEMIGFVSENHYWADIRWSLDENYSDWIWDDPVAGAAWEVKWHALQTNYPKAEDPKRDEKLAVWSKKEAALHKQRPASHRNISYALWETGQHYNRSYIRLGDELGKQIASIWKQGPLYRGYQGTSTKPVGRLTLTGIIKRLSTSAGKEVAARIAKVEAIKAAQAAKNARNTQRRNIMSAAVSLWDALKRADHIELSDVVTQDFYAVLEDLTSLTEEK